MRPLGDRSALSDVSFSNFPSIIFIKLPSPGFFILKRVILSLIAGYRQEMACFSPLHD